jgi:hypothetical protein
MALLVGGVGACGPDEPPPPVPEQPPAPEVVNTPAPAPAPAQGLTCIKGGSTREEVRAVMGEPDSVAFGDWLYGRSSVTFGYGVVLDYSNAGGNLVLCP